MIRKVLYMRTGGRRPICLVRGLGVRDLQGGLPVWWCERCAAEVFERRQRLCRRCRKECDNSEEQNEQSMFDLQQG